MTLATQDSPQRRAVARYILRADQFFRQAARVSDKDDRAVLIGMAELAQRAARAELRVPWMEEGR